ncbi:MAG TPA: hydrogenase maturation protease [Candidatus Acidoferrales bacterium]|nr:hydrogenase maturation protease [Candidatus Acidoferrales bacterium]
MNEWEFHLLEDKPSLESVTIAGVQVKPGDRVRLRPRKGGDVLDIALAGKIATVESIEQDYEGQLHISVVVDDDPGRDIGMMRQPGHRFFFSAVEVEPIEQEPALAEGAKKTPTILVAGIGNIFLGDDAFGVEVVKRFGGRELPDGVRVTDFGIRGFDLTYALIDGADVTILVDACPRGGAAGDLYVVEPDLRSLGAGEVAPAAVDAHSMNPMNVIRAAKAMGGSLKKILLLGCEPATFGPEEGQMGLSEPVASAVERAIPLLESVVRRVLEGEWPLEKT